MSGTIKTNLYLSSMGYKANFGAAAISIDMTGDTMVTASMIYYLRKSRSSFKHQYRIFTLACLLLLSIQDSPNSLLFALFFFIEVRCPKEGVPVTKPNKVVYDLEQARTDETGFWIQH
ncbi:hypothetical protein BT96DRAFT_980652 [Gymnopus androsaceus JB14]|uniref:Uncharacterized protein n=1 Tax=Gymnopus androsaceus JB14 TaxID=1447944 RepID=A0A6A4GX94_9AGAR|nr:hypothetical protein BT96DRAFT_980652 [Gymnopus androsaceus JB14]